MSVSSPAYSLPSLRFDRSLRPEAPPRILLKSIGAGGIGAAVLSSSSGAKGAKAAIGKRRTRTIAKEFAEIVRDRDGFSDWREEGIRSPELFYGKVTADSSATDSVEYTPTAWFFPIEDRGDDVGYVAVSAKQAESPVLTYGRSTAPQRRVDSPMKVAKASGRSVHKRFLYQGGTRFGVETTDRKLVDLRGAAGYRNGPGRGERSTAVWEE